MKKWVLGMVTALAVCVLFASLPGPACAAGLTIADGGWVRVYGGGTISLGCQSVVIQDGGTMELGYSTGSGTLTKCGRVQVDPGGHLYQSNGKIIHNCAVPAEIMLLLLE
jgi:flagellar basal body rod protein FlgF